MKICIDPGHSGPVEPGACAAGYTEAAINISISLLLGQLLQKKGYGVIYTRIGEVKSDGLAFRAEIANDTRADIFLSIHCNAAENPAAYGVETFNCPNSEKGGKLATCIQKSLIAANYTRDRGVKEADFAVLRLTHMPAVLIECGFITSAHDRATLMKRSGQKKIAAAILSGIETYLL